MAQSVMEPRFPQRLLEMKQKGREKTYLHTEVVEGEEIRMEVGGYTRNIE